MLQSDLGAGSAPETCLNIHLSKNNLPYFVVTENDLKINFAFQCNVLC